MAPTIELEATFRRAVEDGINLFTGAGFSVLAKNAMGQTLPVGDRLRQLLVQEFSLTALSNLDLSQLCTVIQSSNQAELRTFLCKQFTVASYDPKYRHLDNLNIRNIFSTNVDDLIYKVFRNNTAHYINDVSRNGPVHNDRWAIDYTPLHGTVVDQYSQLVFSPTAIASAFPQDPDRWHLLTGQLQRMPTLFWGYRLADAGVLQALHPSTVKQRDLRDRWIQLREHDAAAEQYFRALGFKIIISETDALLDYFASVSITNRREATRSTADLFPEYVVPSLGTGPVRPLMDFYQGDVPTWHDIFDGRLHKTQHVATIVDRINARKHTIAIGVPACGKTTTMMQIAAEVAFSGHKLICNNITTEKAAHVTAILNNDPAVIFIDDIGDSPDAAAHFMRHQNIVLVGFEREYNFDVVSHKIDRSLFDLIEVTAISPQDIQEIFSRIPEQVRSRRLNHPKTEQGMQPSIFEVIESNIKSPTLNKRFRRVLNDLAERPPLRDLLVMIAYVHACRTPVSFDMAYAFLRNNLNDYDEVYTHLKNLGSLISEYVGDLVDGNQDHFVPRSTVVSEAIISQTPGPVFAQCLKRFHTDISPLRICRYDIFRRRAFDADYFSRAFPNWEDGRAFYDELHERDPSPYLRQQGALYLAKKKRFVEAFSWIDEAIIKSANRIPSIRHSHAIILFNANIDLAGIDDPKVKETLDRSMQILSDCYKYDKRKNYHATTFADQALLYWNAYSDSSAREYLTTANAWLKEETRRSPWHRRVKQLLAAVENQLAAIDPRRQPRR